MNKLKLVIDYRITLMTDYIFPEVRPDLVICQLQRSNDLIRYQHLRHDFCSHIPHRRAGEVSVRMGVLGDMKASKERGKMIVGWWF